MNVRRYLCVLVVLCFVTVGWAGSKEGEPFGPVSPDELKMTSEPLAPGAPAIVLYRQVDRDDSGTQTTEYNYRRIKILTEEGRKNADIEIPFVKGEGRGINGIKARTIHPDGTIIKYEGKVFDKQIVKAKGLKYMAKTFTMPDVQVGSIIEYEYTESFAEYSLWNSIWVISDDLFTKRAKFSLRLYPRLPCRWTWSRLPEGTPAPKSEGGLVRLEVKNIPAFVTEDFMPPANELKSRVDFIYSDENTENDPEKFWKAVGKKWNSFSEDFVGKRKAMEEAVRQIVAPEDSKETKLQKIYARVQQFRNTGLENPKTEQEQKREKLKDINNVEDIWKRGYANDGDQLTWLFIGLARAAGFDVSDVRVSSRRSYIFSPKAMNEKKLNTSVALVKLDGKDLYLDPGATFIPYGMLPWSETNVIGRKLDKDGGSWVTTPIPDASVSRIERKAELSLSAETGDLEGTLSLTFKGLEASHLRVEELDADDADRKKYLEDLVKEYIPSSAEVQLTNKPEWRSSAPTMVAEFHVKVPGWMAGAGRRAMFPVGVFTATEKGVFTHAERKHPIYFSFPFSKEDDLKITLPLGWEVGGLPAAQEEGAGSPVLYAFKAEKDGSTLHLNRKVKVDFYYLEPKYYPTLQGFFQMIRTGDEQQIVLQPMRSGVAK